MDAESGRSCTQGISTERERTALEGLGFRVLARTACAGLREREGPERGKDCVVFPNARRLKEVVAARIKLGSALSDPAHGHARESRALAVDNLCHTKDENTRKNHVPPRVQIVKRAYGL